MHAETNGSENARFYFLVFHFVFLTVANKVFGRRESKQSDTSQEAYSPSYWVSSAERLMMGALLERHDQMYFSLSVCEE